jgi:hypothetical protein
VPFRRYSVSAVSGFVRFLSVRVGKHAGMLLSLISLVLPRIVLLASSRPPVLCGMSEPAFWAWPYLFVSLVFYPTANHVLLRLLPICWQVNGTPDPVLGGGWDVGTSLEASGGRRICVWRYGRLNATLTELPSWTRLWKMRVLEGVSLESAPSPVSSLPLFFPFSPLSLPPPSPLSFDLSYDSLLLFPPPSSPRLPIYSSLRWEEPLSLFSCPRAAPEG